jgi:hypothetical protein
VSGSTIPSFVAVDVNESSDEVEDEDLGKKLARMAKASRGQWLALVIDLIKMISSRKAEVTSDDVWFFLEGSDIAPIVDGRLLGAAFTLARRHDAISVTDRVQASTRVACHRRPIRIWESRIVGNHPKVGPIARKLFDSKSSEFNVTKRKNHEQRNASLR